MPDVDPQAILAAMGWPAPHAPVPVTGGQDTLIWRVQTPAGPMALRVLRPEQAHVARREAAVLRWLADTDVPVPRLHVAGEYAGRPALLMDWVPGEPLASALFTRPDTAAALGAAFGQAQARLHTLTVPPEVLDLTGGVTLPGISPATRSSLLHLDDHPLNVLVHGGRVSGVIDWANARVGDPRADVARTVSILSVDPFVWGLGGRDRRALLAFRRAYVAALPAGALHAEGLAWAGAYLHADLSRRHGEGALRQVGRWTAWWRTRSACPSPSRPT